MLYHRYWLIFRFIDNHIKNLGGDKIEIDENIDPKPVNDNTEARKKEALIRENENRLRKEEVKKAVVTTSII